MINKAVYPHQDAEIVRPPLRPRYNVLAFDAGSRYTGIAVAQQGQPSAFGLIVTPPGMMLADRLEMVFHETRQWIMDNLPFCEQLDVLIEHPSIAPGRPQQSQVYMMIGLIAGVAHSLSPHDYGDIALHFVDPVAWKRAVTGSSSASKERVEVALRRRYPDEFSYLPDFRRMRRDEFDALGVLTYWLER